MPVPVSNVPDDRSANTEKVSQAKAKQPKVLPIPFSRASKKIGRLGATFATATPWGAQIPANVPSGGFMLAALLTIEGTGGNGSTTVTKKEDAPFSSIKKIIFSDANSAPIQSLSGYEWYLATLYGGYYLYRWDQEARAFTDVVIGASASGNFKFVLPIMAEFGRDGLGCLPNMDASALYKLDISQGAPSDVYGTAPTNPPTLNIAIELLARAQPPEVDQFGRAQQTVPPALNTMQFWTAQTVDISAGDNTVKLNRVGNYIRAHILIFRANSDGTRATGETNVVPSIIEMLWDTGSRFKHKVTTLRQLAYVTTGIQAPAGVVPILNMEDTQGYQGSEYGDDYMHTLATSNLELQFNCANAGKLTILTNDVVGTPDMFAAPYSQIVGGVV